MKMKTANGKLRSALALTLCAAFVMTGCGSAVEEEVAEEAVLVTTQIAQAGSLTLSSSFIGTISPEETVSVYPLASGLVTDTYFEVGDVVNAGDVLFKIDDEAASFQLETALMAAEQAQMNADSAMTTQQDSTNLQLEQAAMAAQSSYEQAQIAYVQAKDAYEDYDKKVDSAKGAADSAASREKAAKDNLAAKEATYEAVVANVASTDEEKAEALEAKTKAQADYEAAAVSAATAKASYDAIKDGSESMRMAYYQAQSAYKAADRGRELTEESANLTQGDVFEDTMAQMQMGIDMANLSADSAALALSYYTVTAPVSGVIESKNVDVNGMASQGMASYTIVNNDTMTVSYYISEKIKNTLKVGQSIVLERNGKTYQASITEIGASVDPQAGLFKVKACVAATGEELPTGVSVKITADTYAEENAIIVPYSTVYYDNAGAYVYLKENDRAVKRYVATGIFDEENIVIENGIELGDEVVTSWSPQLTSGVLLTTTASETETTHQTGDAQTAENAEQAE